MIFSAEEMLKEKWEKYAGRNKKKNIISVDNKIISIFLFCFSKLQK